MLFRLLKLLSNKYIVCGFSLVTLYIVSSVQANSQPVWHESLLPQVVINTNGNEIVPGTKITARCKIINNSSGSVNDTSNIGNIFSGLIGIEIRGQSSQMFPKKSYSVELRELSGEGYSVPLLGMPGEEDWILHAPYSDKSLLRNALAFHLGQAMGRWQPRFRFCTVYINGDYKGIYMLFEKIKRDKNRVNISKLEPFENVGDELTGGYIFKADKYGDLDPSEYFVSYPVLVYPGSRNYVFTYVYPKPELISTNQKAYINNFVTNFEDCLNSSGFNHPEKGYKKYIDVNSFIDFQIIQELTNNVDGYVFSTFFFKERDSKGGKMYAGPIWDFDLGFGNVNYSPINLSTTGWLYPHYNDKYCMHWWERLMQDQEYARSFAGRWKELRHTVFRSDSIDSFIEKTVGMLEPEIEKNFLRWNIIGSYIWPNYYVGRTFEEDLQYFRNWTSGRLAWMDANADGTWITKSESYLNNLLVYPNPASDNIYFATDLVTTAVLYADLFDNTGRLTKSVSVKPAFSGFQEFSLSVSDMSSGLYYFRLRTANKILGGRKIVITGRK